jgi:hypothetical protein
MIKFIDRVLDEYFFNSYKLHIRLGDLIEDKGQTLYVEDIISETVFVCSTVDNGNENFINSEKQYNFNFIKPIENKVFFSWACWIAK